MKYLLVVLSASILLTNCSSNSSDTYSIQGDAIGFEDNTKIIAFSFEKGQAKALDTIIIQDQKFEKSFPKEGKSTLNFLKIDHVNSNLIYFNEDKDLKATIYKDSVYASRISGSPQNDNYNKFMNDALTFQKKKEKINKEGQQAMQQGELGKITELQSRLLNIENEEKEMKKNFIKNNRSSLFSLMLIGELLSQQEINSTEATELLDNMDSKIAQNEMSQELRTAIDRMKIADIGTKAPDFSGPTPEGNELALSDVLGKYTIIDFWASWCTPCRVENPNVVEVYKKYHEKGLNIISVSLDQPGKRDAWLEAIKKDEMDWYHISNLQFWNDPIAAKYGVRAIPATFLLDENGMIIDKNLRGQALHAKMATLFAEK